MSPKTVGIGVRLAGFRHRIPWNGLFWSLTAILWGTAIFFTIGTFHHRSPRYVDESAVLVSGDVIEVVLIRNGDEIEVRKGGHVATARMLGIRSFDPVVNEREITAYGHTSMRYLEQRILNKDVRLIFDDPIQDVHGRYLAYVELDGIDVNRQMLDEGISMVYTEFPFAREALYLSTESLARRHVRGIWGGKKSTARIMGLRREWAGARRQRTGHFGPDYLLGEIP